MLDKGNINDNKDTLKDISTLKEDEPVKKKKHPALKFLLYFSIILIATGIALFLSLYQDFDGVIAALRRSDYRYLLLSVGLVAISYFLEGFIIFMFARLYTRRYHWHRGMATSMVGAFYSAITPGASGGQAMQIYTMKKQGVEVSSAASIMIMSFIIYQSALIIIGIVGIVFKWDLVMSIGNFSIDAGAFKLSVPAIPFTLIGFALNVLVIVGLIAMSYSHKFHNFIMHYGINLFAKLRIIRNPEEKRESLRIQVENFKIELRRLLSNFAVTIVVFICFSLVLIIRFSIPYFAGIALDGYGYLTNLDGSLVIGVDGPLMSTGSISIQSFWDAVFLSSYHQMVAGLVPIPGAAGVSEYFFNTIFSNYFVSQQVTTAAQIIWRFTTFHLVLFVSGIVAASYHVTPDKTAEHANKKAYVTIQLETYETRKISADTMFETASLNRKEIQERLRNWNKNGKKHKRNDDYDEASDKPVTKTKPQNKRPQKSTKKVTRKNTNPEDDWDDFSTGV